MTAPDLSMVAATDQDDGFAVYSMRTGSTVADEGDNDRTHKATIDGRIRVNYSATGGPIDQSVPVCDRIPMDERKEVRIRVHVFNEPFDDYGLDGMPGTGDTGEGNGIHDLGEPIFDVDGDGVLNTVLGSTANATTIVNSEIERTNIAWAHTCIRFTLVGSIMFEDAPTSGGANIFRDRRFDISPPSDDVTVITNATGVTPNVADVFFVPPIPGASGYARVPANMGSSLPGALGENTYLFIGSNADIRRRSLAHEFGHALTNSPDSTTPTYVYFPSFNGSTFDDTVNRQRRLTNMTENQSRTCRAAGSLTAVGNRLVTGCP